MNLRCPSAPTTVEVKVAEVDIGEAAKDPREDVVVEEHG